MSLSLSLDTRRVTGFAQLDSHVPGDARFIDPATHSTAMSAAEVPPKGAAGEEGRRRRPKKAKTAQGRRPGGGRQRPRDTPTYQKLRHSATGGTPM